MQKNRKSKEVRKVQRLNKEDLIDGDGPATYPKKIGKSYIICLKVWVALERIFAFYSDNSIV